MRVVVVVARAEPNKVVLVNPAPAMLTPAALAAAADVYAVLWCEGPVRQGGDLPAVHEPYAPPEPTLDADGNLHVPDGSAGLRNVGRVRGGIGPEGPPGPKGPPGPPGSDAVLPRVLTVTTPKADSAGLVTGAFTPAFASTPLARPQPTVVAGALVVAEVLKVSPFGYQAKVWRTRTGLLTGLVGATESAPGLSATIRFEGAPS